MVDVRGVRHQDTYPAVGTDDRLIALRANNRGELVVPDFYEQLVQDGNVYIGSNAARETAEAMAGTSFTDTDPALLLDVPSGTTVVPLEIEMRQGGSVAGAIITYLITIDNAVRYSSGGIAITGKNMRDDDPNSHNASLYSGSTNIVAAANTNDTTLKAGQLVQDLDALDGGHVEWSARKNIAPFLVGPASLLVYTFAGSTEPSWFWHITWAEIPTVSVT